MIAKRKMLLSAVWFAVPFLCAVGAFELTPLVAAFILGATCYPFFLGEPRWRRFWWGGLCVSLGISFAYGAKVFLEDPTTYFGFRIVPITGFVAGVLGIPVATLWGWCLSKLRAPLEQRGWIEPAS